MKKVVTISLFLSMSSEAIDQNCTVVFPPYYLSDSEVLWFSYFQIGSGVLASAFMAHNFIAAWYFYRREQKDLLRLLKKHRAEKKRENDLLLESLKELKEQIGE